MASERTALAWGRTCLSLAVVAAAVMGVSLRHDLVALAVTVGPLMIAATLALIWRAHASYERRRTEQRWAADPLAILVVAAVTIAGAVVAAVAGVLAAV
jgi:uncharacterized membrane protein YidH (DUF202 family)